MVPKSHLPDSRGYMTSPGEHKPGTGLCPSERKPKGISTGLGLKSEASFYFLGNFLLPKSLCGTKRSMEKRKGWNDGEGGGKRKGGEKERNIG